MANAIQNVQTRFVTVDLPGVMQMSPVGRQQEPSAITIFVKRRAKEHCSKTAMVCIGALLFFGTLIGLFINYLLLVNSVKIKHQQDYFQHLNSSQSLTTDYFFVHLTDIHLDLFYQTQCHHQDRASTSSPINWLYGRYGCDSPSYLVDSALNSISKHMSTHQELSLFILVSGDLVAHHCVIRSQPSPGSCSTLNDFYHTVTIASRKLANAFYNRSIIVAIGNYDIPITYLQRNSEYIWYQRLFNLWQPMISCKGCSSLHQPSISPSFRKDFLSAGYYYLDYSAVALKVITLNTIYWDQSVYNEIPLGSQARFNALGDQQMEWLSEQLRQAKRQNWKAIIHGHLPPGFV